MNACLNGVFLIIYILIKYRLYIFMLHLLLVYLYTECNSMGHMIIEITIFWENGC